MTQKIRVLVVDDSAFARKVVREVLSQDEQIDVVGIARDGIEALEKIPELRPDVITLDLVMPDLDGIGFLRALPQENAPRVIVVTASSVESEVAIEALENGAVEIVMKPTPLPTDRLYELSNELVNKVKAAYVARPRPLSQVPVVLAQLPKVSNAQTKFIAVGTSTGGPQALTELFRSLPKDLPVPIAIALHIPAGYTAPLAARLTNLGNVPVEEAVDGMQIKAGTAVIAPGGKHLKIRSDGEHFFAVVTMEPVETLHHPSVDVLFESVAECTGDGAVAIVMTGMGEDGTSGSRAIRARGGKIVVESASSCVVYGMPRSVVEAGLADFEAPLEKLASVLIQKVLAQ